MNNLIPGRATGEGTAAYTRRFAPAAGHFRQFNGLTYSSLGLGTYLGENNDETDDLYTQAVLKALESGINVLDTAINYRNMRSERAVGRALQQAFALGLVKREEVVVATKGGYLPFDGRIPDDPQAYIEHTYITPGIFGVGDLAAGCHCMTPRYLADQLERSRQNLALETIDVYYLHNLETQLTEISRDEFMIRIRTAFEFLESACRDGKIGLYGVATWNGFRQNLSAKDYLSVTALAGMAYQVSGAGHHFRVIQLPYNLAQPEAYTLFNQPVQEGRVSFLKAAAEHGLYVMTSASILQGALIRDLPVELKKILTGLTTDAQRALQFVRSTPGVGTALVGMKHAAHVEENVHLVQVPPVSAGTIRSLYKEP